MYFNGSQDNFDVFPSLMIFFLFLHTVQLRNVELCSISSRSSLFPKVSF